MDTIFSVWRLFINTIILVHCTSPVYCEQDLPADSAIDMPQEAQSMSITSGYPGNIVTSSLHHRNSTHTLPDVSVQLKGSHSLTYNHLQTSHTLSPETTHNTHQHTSINSHQQVSIVLPYDTTRNALPTTIVIQSAISTTVMMNSSLPLLDSNTIFILATSGTLLLIVTVTAIIIGIVCICKSRWKKEKLTPSGVNLKRTNTTRSSNSSDFVFSSPYEWTCRQTRLLSHLRPDTTGYQSHWSLTRDVKKQRSAIDIDNKEPHTQTNTVHTTTQNGLSTTGEHLKVSSSSLTQRNYVKGGSTNSSACVVIENRFPHHARSSDLIDCNGTKVAPVHENGAKFTQNDDPTDAFCENDSRMEQISPKKVPGIIHVSNAYHNSNRSGSAGVCNMYNNPLYIKKMESKREDVKKDNECYENQEENDLCSEVSISSHAAAPMNFFLLPDNEAYDSGNASAVSTDIASTLQISTKPAANIDTHRTSYLNGKTCTSSTAIATTADGCESVVESSSFEFSNKSGFEDTVN